MVDFFNEGESQSWKDANRSHQTHFLRSARIQIRARLADGCLVFPQTDAKKESPPAPG